MSKGQKKSPGGTWEVVREQEEDGELGVSEIEGLFLCLSSPQG